MALAVPAIVRLGPEFEMEAEYTHSGRAAGRIRGLDSLLDVLEERKDEFDAVAISSQIGVPPGYHAEYFESNGEMVNPWGGVEAMLTHAVSTIFDVPSAHAPMLETQEIANSDPGIVDPRMAAEAVSLALIQSVLKGIAAQPGHSDRRRGLKPLRHHDRRRHFLPGNTRRLPWHTRPGGVGTGNQGHRRHGEPQPDAE